MSGLVRGRAGVGLEPAAEQVERERDGVAPHPLPVARHPHAADSGAAGAGDGEVERGQKEASSELLASICRALGVRLSDVLRDVSDSLSVLEPEPRPLPVGVKTIEPAAAPDVRDVVAAA